MSRSATASMARSSRSSSCSTASRSEPAAGGRPRVPKGISLSSMRCAAQARRRRSSRQRRRWARRAGRRQLVGDEREDASGTARCTCRAREVCVPRGDRARTGIREPRRAAGRWRTASSRNRAARTRADVRPMLYRSRLSPRRLRYPLRRTAAAAACVIDGAWMWPPVETWVSSVFMLRTTGAICARRCNRSAGSGTRR